MRVVTRKPFIITSLDPAKEREREMAIFTAAKKLSEYIYIVTEKSPKKYRWSIITKIQNASIAVIEDLYLANFEEGAERLAYQKQAGVQLRLIDHYAEVAYKLKAIPFKQMEHIAYLIIDARKLLAGWSKCTKNRRNCQLKLFLFHFCLLIYGGN